VVPGEHPEPEIGESPDPCREVRRPDPEAGAHDGDGVAFGEQG